SCLIAIGLAATQSSGQVSWAAALSAFGLTHCLRRGYTQRPEHATILADQARLAVEAQRHDPFQYYASEAAVLRFLALLASYNTRAHFVPRQQEPPAFFLAG